MTPEVRDRIEQIRHGNVPEGYADTQVGIVPDTWDVCRLQDVLKRRTTKNTQKVILNILTNSAARGIVPQRDFFDKQIVNDENTDLYYVVQPGCFVYNPRISVTAPCGPFNRYNGIKDGIMSPLYTVYEFVGKSLEYSAYLEQYFSSAHWYRYMYSIANYGARSDRMNVTNDDMDALPLPYPPVAEQQKIAEILATQDKVIELKEKRVAEKQKQKRCLMQQLLTGKNRLPGFEYKWRYAELGKIAKKEKEKNRNFVYTLVLSNSAQHGIIPQTDQFDKEIAREDRIDGYYIVREGFFVYNPRISVTAPCGPINQNETGRTGVMSPLYTVFSVETGAINKEFLKQYFSSSCWHRHMKSVANYGARHDRMNVSDEDFFLMPIPVPGIEEQSAIAQILSSADKEISLLCKELEQEKQKKKALMQLLLSGIVRV